MEVIARLVATSQDRVREMIHRFNESGMASLDPKWAGGRPRRITADDEAFIVETARQRPERLSRKSAQRDELRGLGCGGAGTGPPQCRTAAHLR